MIVKVELMPSGKPRTHSSVGGYPVFYVCAGDVLCPRCALESEKAGDEMDATDANWENPELHCGECSERIESAYAESE